MKRRLVTVDCDYLFPEFAAAYLRIEGGQAAFVDNNTYHSVPKLMAALQREGLTPDSVQWVIITHVHLDHAGGSSRLMELCPNATLLAHPRAAPHVIDPTKLVASARKVYGDAIFEKLYGEIKPIDAKRVRIMGDGEKISFGDSEFQFLHTRGHANHHFCVWDPALATIYTGDAFGLRYPSLQGGGLFVFPSTSPTDFDAAEAIASVDRIVATGAKVACPTHFGEVREVQAAAGQLKEHLEFSGKLLERAAEGPEAPPDAELESFCEQEVRRHYETYLNGRGIHLTPTQWAMLNLDLKLNGQGIAHVARKRRMR